MATIKQKLAAKEIAESIRNKKPKPIGTVLRAVGYSESTSLNPDQVTKGKGFKELLDHYLPESLVTKRHGQLLNASQLQHYVFPQSMEDDDIQEIVESVAGCRLIKISNSDNSKRAYYWSPNTTAQDNAVDKAYKLRGNYKPTQIDVRSFVGWTPQELEEYASSGTIPERFITES